MVFQNIKGKDALKNLGRIYSAQIVSFGFSLLMSLYVPKLLGVEEFSYWQLFLFYASYMGVLQLGLNDGIYLRFGGKELTNEEENLISNQLHIMTLGLIFLSVLFILIILSCSFRETPKTNVLIYVAIYSIIYNIYGYCGSVLQATNNFNLYSRNIIIEKSLMTIAIILIACLNINNFNIITICYILATSITDFLFIIKAKNLFLKPLYFSKRILLEIFTNISVGINLMFSNIASALIIGICRFIISEHYPINVFGYVSFSLTLCGFCLLFISQIGNAIYPILKKKDGDFHKLLFKTVDFLLCNLTPVFFLSYPLLSIIVNVYLPTYKNALIYFAALLPLCIFEAKISILYGTFMKVLRLEKQILYINLFIMFISALFSTVGILIIGGISISLVGVSICVLLKALLMQKQVVKHLGYLKEHKAWSMDILITLLYFTLIIVGIQPVICAWIAVFTSLVNICFQKPKLVEAFHFFIIKR